jgi:hypothetical protein
MVVNVKTVIYWDVRAYILVDVYTHFVGTCCVFIPVLKMNILKEYIASTISSVQTVKLADGRKHSQGIFHFYLEDGILYLLGDILEKHFVTTIFSSS